MTPVVSVSISHGSSMQHEAATREATPDKVSATDYKSLVDSNEVIGLDGKRILAFFVPSSAVKPIRLKYSQSNLVVHDCKYYS